MLALLLSLATAADVGAPPLPDPVTLPQAEEIFLARGLDLLIADAQLAAAQGALRSARQLANPIVNGAFLYSFQVDPTGAAASLMPGSSPALPGFTVGLADNALIEHLLTGKQGLQIEVASRALEVARLTGQDVRRTLLSQLRVAFLSTLLARQTLAFAEQVQESFTRTRAISQLRLEKGDISKVDLARIVSVQLEALQQRSLAAGALADATAGLGFLLGVRGQPFNSALAGELAYAPVPRLEQAGAEGLLKLARDHRPDLLAANAELSRNETSVTLARRQVVPDIGLSASYSQQYNSGLPNGLLGPPTLTVGLQAPLPVFGQQQGEIARAEADREASARRRDKAEAQLLLDLAQGLSRFQGSRERVQRMEGELLAAAKEARDLEELSYQKGEASLLEFLDAQRTYVAVSLEHLQGLAAYWEAVYRLEEATGVELR